MAKRGPLGNSRLHRLSDLPLTGEPLTRLVKRQIVIFFFFFKAILSRGIGHRAWLVSVQFGLAQPVDDEPWVRITARTEFCIESREVTTDSFFEKHLSKQGGISTRLSPKTKQALGQAG